MKRLLLLLPLLSSFNARPVLAVGWAHWLAYTYCEARQAGFGHERAVEMMFYEGNNGYDHIRIPWQKAMREDRQLANEIVSVEIGKRDELGMCGQ